MFLVWNADSNRCREQSEEIVPIYMNFALDFKSVPGPGGTLHVGLHSGEVQGFDASSEPTQDDVNAVTSLLDELYSSLPKGQQVVLSQVLRQAALASG